MESSHPREDTIVALGTAPGEGAIGIVRISGDRAIELVSRVFAPASGKDLRSTGSFRMRYGYVVEPASGEVIDEVLVSVMRGPRSYTGEDVVEINCHGGMVPISRIIHLMTGLGARVAEPGEFTRRAFMNGRIDLAQAEAVLDVIRTRTDKGLRTAIGQVRGALSSRIRGMREKVADLLSQLDAVLDFPEDDLGDVDVEALARGVRAVRAEVGELISQGLVGRIYRDGIKVVIAGKPNVGKSSLLNALLGEERAIVSEIPGTTRDIIEEAVNVKGIPMRVIDTAGIRGTEDVLEKIGVERAGRSIEEADLVIIVLDLSSPLGDEDKQVFGMVGGAPGVVALNKADVPPASGVREAAEDLAGGRPVVEVSAATGAGIEALKDAVYEVVIGGKVAPAESPVVSNSRHVEAFERVAKSLDAVLRAADLGLPADIMAVDLREALTALGEITGETVDDEVIDRIFANFCIGK